MRRTRQLALTASFGLAVLSGCVGTRSESLLDLRPTPTAAPSSASSPPSQEELSSKESASLSLAMAESLEKQNKESEALVYYENARQLDPALNERAARRLAILYDRHDQQAKGMIEFQQLLQKYPRDSSLLNDVGYSNYNRGQWKEAETYLLRATKADRTNKRAWINLGMTLAQQGKYDEAFVVFTKAVSSAEAHANLGFVKASQPNRRAEAIESYRQALTIEPTLEVAQKALKRLEAPETTQRVPLNLPSS